MHTPLNSTIFKRQRGDTLVEVLIAIAVVSLILGGAYIATNQSLTATRAAQERGNALKLAESQIEQLKGIVSDPTRSDLIFGAAAPTTFCISTANVPVPTSHDDCAVGTSGTHATVEPIFHLSIVRAGNDFTLTETWFNVNGKTTDTLRMNYRAYE